MVLRGIYRELVACSGSSVLVRYTRLPTNFTLPSASSP
jgi:hypothetical protein